MDRLYTQSIEITGCDVFANSVNFIDNEMKGFIVLPQILHQRFVAGMNSGPTVH